MIDIICSVCHVEGLKLSPCDGQFLNDLVIPYQLNGIRRIRIVTMTAITTAIIVLTCITATQ